MRWCIALIGLLAPSAYAIGVSAEAGPAIAAGTIDVEGAASAKFSVFGLSHIELRGKVLIALPPLVTPRVQGVGVALRYRTPPLGSMPVEFTIAAGLGAQLWFGCVVGDSCGALGGFLDIAPTFELHVTPALGVFLAFNASVGFLANGTIAPLFIGSLSLGLSFDFLPVERKPPDDGPVPSL